MPEDETPNTPRSRFLELTHCATAAGALRHLAPKTFAAETVLGTITDGESIAREIQILRDKKHSCSQATFVGICKAIGTKLSEEQLLAISAGFAGGIGKTFNDGSCGALVGGVMAVGWYLRGQTDEAVTRSKMLFEDFKKHEGTVVCKDILEKYGGFANCTNCCLYVGEKVSQTLKGCI